MGLLKIIWMPTRKHQKYPLTLSLRGLLGEVRGKTRVTQTLKLFLIKIIYILGILPQSLLG